MTNLRERREKQIIKAAIEIFGTDGFYKGTVEDIARKADIGKGTVYQYFSSKQEVFENMIIYILEGYLKGIARATAQEDRVRDKFVTILDYNENFAKNNAKVLEESMLGFDKMSSNYRPKIMELHQEIFQFICQLVEEGKKAGEIRQSIKTRAVVFLWLNMVNGMNNTQCMFNINELVDNKEIVDIFFDGLK